MQVKTKNVRFQKTDSLETFFLETQNYFILRININDINNSLILTYKSNNSNVYNNVVIQKINNIWIYDDYINDNKRYIINNKIWFSIM